MCTQNEPSNVNKTRLFRNIYEEGRKNKLYLYHLRIQAQLYPILQDLCNDTQYEVRAIACQSLAPVCKLLGPDITMNMVVPEMSKYLCDESVLVKTSCFQSLIDILDLFEDRKLKFHFILI